MLDKRKSTCGQTPEAFTCQLCNFKTDFKIILHYHVRNVHKNLHKNEKTLFKKIVKYKCKCNFATYSVLLWFKHNVRKNLDMKEFTKVYRFECTFCPFKAAQKVTLQLHIRNRHTPSEEIKWLCCSQCVFKTKSKSSLLRHTSVIHENTDALQWFSCDLCNYKTQQEMNLKRHKNYNHSSPEHTVWHNCPKCEYKTKHRGDLKLHLRRRHTEFKYECTLCPFKANKGCTLKYHMINKHTPPEEKEWLHCPKCNFRTTIQPSLTRHLKLRHRSDEPDYITCDSCNDKIQQNLKKLKSEELYECTECSFKSGHSMVLKCHMIRQHAIPHDAEWYNCAHCSYRSKTRSDILSHIRLKHTKEKPGNQTGIYFTCNFCSLRTIYPRALDQHVIRCHTAPEEIHWFECDQCSYKGKCKEYLSHHKKMHHSDTSDKKFSCNICQFKTTVEEALKRHITQTHSSGKLLLECPHCFFTTRYQVHLKQHIVREHTDPEKVEWFTCNDCDYKAKVKGYLARHIKIIHENNDKKMFSCDLCDYKSTTKWNVKRHKVSMHSTEKK
ncbi:zinc finger protein 142-like [Tribolium madens]|uniref:zinc finger protein 142-like n=1 Tax=Tribolium madens TaxID=41895 RepID=UPI001CF75713|nr:zinc finger protein 142-like [Tribolium madens]